MRITLRSLHLPAIAAAALAVGLVYASDTQAGGLPPVVEKSSMAAVAAMPAEPTCVPLVRTGRAMSG